ncbi:hypothetical protein [Porphyrobacter sp. YT40]|uniref:hypothetical protein n=1 Tax=Porphyrobacter sp. YT40 TaxID=2547601 RepID=UPI0011419E46|nr:hypothetical protein [Porphyrobacter sp. YT40]QDH33320.1 hypothetical protein E2E27_02605 [Porphyrobacter sp. YT40]
MMRPASIIRFEQIILGSLALGIVNTVLSYDTTMAQIEADPGMTELGMSGPGFLIGSVVIGFGISLLLWFFVSRRASTVAKWILVVLTLIGLLSVPLALFDVPFVQAAITFVTAVMQLAALWFLFRPDANAWFEHGPRGMDPSTFD